MVNFGRAECGNPAISAQKEWLVTNGLGGYAMGTVAGSLSGELAFSAQPFEITAFTDREGIGERSP